MQSCILSLFVLMMLAACAAPGSHQINSVPTEPSLYDPLTNTYYYNKSAMSAARSAYCETRNTEQNCKDVPIVTGSKNAPWPVEVDTSKYEIDTKVTARPLKLGDRSGDSWLVTIVMLYKKGQPTRYMLHADNAYVDSEWRFWNRMTTDRAESLDLIHKNRDVVDCSSSNRICSYTEYLIAPLSRAIMQRSQQLSVQVSSREGNRFIIDIPNTMRQAILEQEKLLGM